MLRANGSIIHIENLTISGGSSTTSKGIDGNSGTVTIYLCNFTSALANAIVSAAAGGLAVACSASGCTGTAFQGMDFYGCVAYSNSGTGFGGLNAGNALIDCISVGNSGASSDGFALNNTNMLINCTSYNNGNNGFNGFSDGNVFVNCLAVDNAAYGFSASSAEDNTFLYNCAGYNNASGNVNTTNLTAANLNFVTLAGDPTNNAGGGDYSLNNTGGAGAACRAAGLLGAFSGVATTGYRDVGAVQSKYSAGALIAGVLCARPHPSQFQ